MRTVTLNNMPAPTFNRLRLNGAPVQLGELHGGVPEPWAALPEGIVQSTMPGSCPAPAISALGAVSAERGVETRLVCGSKAAAPARLEYSLRRGTAAALRLCTEKDAEMTVIMYITAEGDGLVQTTAEVSENAHLRLVQVIEGGTEAQVLNDVSAEVSDSGRFSLTQIYLGGKKTVSGIAAELSGYRSEFDCRIGYLIGSDEALDINSIVLHKGKKSHSSTDVKGVLSGSAEKIFRGTIDFKNGASGAVGKETEDVLLMSENTVNKTVPVILCAEEDVEGSHGASIGRLGDDIVYYMTSRGIPAEKAYELIAAARLESLIGSIGDEQTASRALTALERRSCHVSL